MRKEQSFWKQDSTLMSLLYNSYTNWKKELDIVKLKDLAPVKWMTTKDESIMLRLIEGMHDPAFKYVIGNAWKC